MLEEKKVLFLSGMTCSGKSCLLGLLRNNPEIFSIPWGIHFFLFYRKNNFQFLEKKKIVDFWYDFFKENQNIKAPRNQKLGNNPIAYELNIDLFRDIFSNKIERIPISIKNLFYALHYSYAESASIDLSKVKYIAYEYLFVHFEESIGQFYDYKVIQVVRDMPLLLFSTLNRALVKKNPVPFGAFVNRMVDSFILSADIEEKSGNRLKYIKLEELKLNKTKTLEKICQWLDVEYCDDMEHQVMTGYPFTQKKIMPENKKALMYSLGNTIFKTDQEQFGYLNRNVNPKGLSKYLFLMPLPNEFFIRDYVSNKYSKKVLNQLAYIYINLRVFINGLKNYLFSRYSFYKNYIRKGRRLAMRRGAEKEL